MLKTFLYPINATYTNIWQLIKPGNTTMLGIGRTSAWSIESAPPAPATLITDVEQLIGYVPLKKGGAAIRVNSQTGDSFGVDGKFYRSVEASTINTIRATEANQVYLEFEIDHNLISAGKFRSVGVYKNVEFSQELLDAAIDGEVEKKGLYEVEDLTGDLCYVENFPPISVTNNLIQTIKLVING